MLRNSNCLAPLQLIALWLIALCCVNALAPAVGEAADSSPKIDFERDVRPLLAGHCVKCHGPEKQQGGVRLDQRATQLRPADSGSRPVVPGRPGESEMIRRLEAADPSERMPPNAEPLEGEQIAILRLWIEQGAPAPELAAPASDSRREMVVTDDDRRHWSYVPLSDVPLPAVKNRDWARTPVDRFILEAQDAKELAPATPAGAAVLVRRVYYDLLGLPPSPADVQAFVADRSPAAYEALVDRLLASPQYGERWGRHWLDLARYADSDGLETDRDRPTAFHYRDFVIQALNADLSFETFARWQLAGDEYEPDNPLALAATGFLTGAPCEMLMVPMEEEKLRLRYNELDDMAVTTVSAFLGLTLGCARCHDHKFDAIPTRDYYRLQSAFTTTSRANVLLTTRAEAARYRQMESEWNGRMKMAQSQLKDWLAQEQKPFTALLKSKKIDALPISDDEKKLLKEEPESETAKKLAKQHEKALLLTDDDYRKAFDGEQRKQWDVFQDQLNPIERMTPPSPPQELAITDGKSEPEPTSLVKRGDFYAKSAAVQLGFLSVLTNGKQPEAYWTVARTENPTATSTLQRRALAEWMTDVEHGAGALLARVAVNRIWQHHFGEGLVRTPGDFGVRGERPTHPELLEWLAGELGKGGWQLKTLHRLVLISSVSRQGTAFDNSPDAHL